MTIKERKKSRLSALFNQVIADPGVGFAAGNHILAWSVAGVEGIAVSAAALVLTTALGCYKAFSGRPAFNSLYITAGFNMVTAASAYYNSAVMQGETMTGIFSAAALGLWGAAHFFLARREANEGRHGKVFSNPFLYSLGGNVASLQVNGVQIIPTLFVVGSALRSLFPVSSSKEKVDGAGDFLNKHITPVRFTAAAFISGAIIAYINKDPSYMAAQAVWAWAAFNLDKDKNSALVKDTQDVLRSAPRA